MNDKEDTSKVSKSTILGATSSPANDSNQNTMFPIPARHKSNSESISNTARKKDRKSRSLSSECDLSGRVLEIIEGFEKRNTWKYANKRLSKRSTGQGEIFLMEQISNSSKKAALKVYKNNRIGLRGSSLNNKHSDQSSFEDPTRMRSHREMMAIHAIKDISNVPHLIDTNIPDNMNDTINNNNTLWILVDFIPGCSLIDFIKNYQHKISLLEAVNFCIKLLNIINSFHECGIVHRDIKPGNIHIECQNRTSFDKEQITVLDFGQAYIQKGENIEDTVDFGLGRCTTANTERMGNHFYRVPQLDLQQTESMSPEEKTKIKQLRRSPTIDASSVCAILFWLMMDPKSKSCPAYHGFLHANSNIVNQIKQAVDDAGNKCDTERVKIYLTHLFDRGFAKFDKQWTVDQLSNYLRLIQQFITINSPIDSLHTIPTKTTSCDYFTNAIGIFSKAKDAFVKKLSSDEVGYKWALNARFYWKDEILPKQDERKNVDLLSCSHKNDSWNIYIECLAIMNAEQQLKLLVGSVVEGVTIQLPVYILSINTDEFMKPIEENLQKIINEAFERELRTLIEVFHDKNIK